MKNILRTVFPAVLLLTVLSSPAFAQTKIATVDMRKVFDNYYRTKQAQAAIQDQRTQLAKDDASMKDDLKKAGDDYNQLLAKANDPAISADEHERRKQAAADAKKQLDQRAAAIDQFERTADTRLRNQLQQMHDKIMNEIQSHLNAMAKAAGDNLVIDTSARTITLGAAGSMDLPSEVAYSDGSNDLTADLLKQLNAGAPIDMTPASSAPVASPIPSMSNTNGL